MDAQIGQAVLVAVLAVPAAGAAAIALLPGRRGAVIAPAPAAAEASSGAGARLDPIDRLGRLIGVVTAAITFLLSLTLFHRGDGGWFDYRPTGAGGSGVNPWYDLDASWVPSLHLRFHLGVDGISYPLVVLTTLLVLLCAGYTLWHSPGSVPGRWLTALLLVLEVGILGTFLALDLVLFFVFFEVVLLPMYAVIALWGGPDRRRAANKFVLYTLFGSVLLLVGVFTVVSNAGTADLVELTGAHGTLSRSTQLAAFIFLAIGFAVKAPLWPLHTWLPAAHTEAPTVGSVILAGVLLKMGTYGLIRVAVGVAPDGARRMAGTLGVLAVAAIVIGSLVCLAQSELKRLIAYSSVGHMGFVLLGIATLSATGLQAALIGNVAHGIITGLLFFLAGAIKDRAHTGALADLGGLRETAPRLAGLLGFAAIASLGLPGLAGFWGEAFAVVAALGRESALWNVLAAVAAVGGALTAAYFLRLLRHVTHGPPTPVVAGLGRLATLSWVEAVTWAPLVLLAIGVGLVPALVLGVAHDPVQALTEAVRP